MERVRVDAEISVSDLDAAHRFISKRCRRHDDPLQGLAVALHSVMFVIGDALTECGLPVSEVESLFDQAKAQVAFQLHSGGLAEMRA